MTRRKLPRDASLRALEVVRRATAEPDPSESFDALAARFWKETGVIAPGKDIPVALGEPPWTHDERWATWREWNEARKRGRPSAARAAASSRGGKKGGPARAAKLSPERRSEIAKKAAAARWAKK